MALAIGLVVSLMIIAFTIFWVRAAVAEQQKKLEKSVAPPGPTEKGKSVYDTVDNAPVPKSGTPNPHAADWTSPETGKEDEDHADPHVPIVSSGYDCGCKTPILEYGDTHQKIDGTGCGVPTCPTIASKGGV